MIDFQAPRLSDREWVKPLLRQSDYRACDYNFTNLLIWGGTYGPQIAREGEMLLIRVCSPVGCGYLWPAGAVQPEGAVELLAEDARERGAELRLLCLTPEQMAQLEACFPGRFAFTASRERFDYLYDIHRLADLGGKKLHAKRNHINRFLENYPGWSYARLGPEAFEECMELDRQWHLRSLPPGTAAERAEQDEAIALRTALEHWEALELEGGLLRVDGQMVAFTIGSRLSSDTFDVHFEKAYGEMQGSYALINREFARQVRADHPDICWMNREEDLGLEGLRRAKESYYPDRLTEKHRAVLQ